MGSTGIRKSSIDMSSRSAAKCTKVLLDSHRETMCISRGKNVCTGGRFYSSKTMHRASARKLMANYHIPVVTSLGLPLVGLLGQKIQITYQL